MPINTKHSKMLPVFIIVAISGNSHNSSEILVILAFEPEFFLGGGQPSLLTVSSCLRFFMSLRKFPQLNPVAYTAVPNIPEGNLPFRCELQLTSQNELLI